MADRHRGEHRLVHGPQPDRREQAPLGRLEPARRDELGRDGHVVMRPLAALPREAARPGEHALEVAVELPRAVGERDRELGVGRLHAIGEALDAPEEGVRGRLRREGDVEAAGRPGADRGAGQRERDLGLAQPHRRLDDRDLGAGRLAEADRDGRLLKPCARLESEQVLERTRRRVEVPDEARRAERRVRAEALVAGCGRGPQAGRVGERVVARADVRREGEEGAVRAQPVGDGDESGGEHQEGRRRIVGQVRERAEHVGEQVERGADGLALGVGRGGHVGRVHLVGGVERPVVPGGDLHHGSQRVRGARDRPLGPAVEGVLGEGGEEAARRAAVVEAFAVGRRVAPRAPVAVRPSHRRLGLEPGVGLAEVVGGGGEHEQPARIVAGERGPERGHAGEQVRVCVQPRLGDEADVDEVAGERVPRPVARLAVRRLGPEAVEICVRHRERRRS